MTCTSTNPLTNKSSLNTDYNTPAWAMLQNIFTHQTSKVTGIAKKFAAFAKNTADQAQEIYLKSVSRINILDKPLFMEKLLKQHNTQGGFTF